MSKIRSLYRPSRETLWLNAYNGVLEQGAFAFDIEKGMCMYRTNEGNKCGVGHSLADKDYSPDMEDVSAGHLAFLHGDANGTIFSGKLTKGEGRRARFLDALQRVHDKIAESCATPDKPTALHMEVFVASMIAFARNEKLKIDFDNLRTF